MTERKAILQNIDYRAKFRFRDGTEDLPFSDTSLPILEPDITEHELERAFEDIYGYRNGTEVIVYDKHAGYFKSMNDTHGQEYLAVWVILPDGNIKLFDSDGIKFVL